MIQKTSAQRAMLKRLARSVLALFLSILLAPANVGAQAQDRAAKTYEKLSKLPPNAEIDVRLLNGTRIRGHVIRYDRTELILAEHNAPILLAEIKSIKQVHQQSVWNPLTGFARSWKVALIACGLILLVGVYAAKNTR
jgi:hypothetical protein